MTFLATRRRLVPAVWLSAVLGWWAATNARPADAMEHVRLRYQGKEHSVSGRVLVEADNGLTLESRDGTIWLAVGDNLISRSHDDEPFAPFTPEEMGQAVLKELPAGFEVYHTQHFVIVYATSPAYAKWCGGLFERLYANLTGYFAKRGFKTQEPEFPLTAILFGDRPSYVRHAKNEVGPAVSTVIGYYSIRTNRMTMYDLSGTTKQGRQRNSTYAQIQQILSQPEAATNIATIAHEATHQIAFNCGFHTRFSACPRWFSEGLAMYFETPDISGTKALNLVGAVNRFRLDQFRDSMERRPKSSLKMLLTDDNVFLNTDRAIDAYAEAWAWTFFLNRRYPKQYVAYIERLSKKPTMRIDDAATRLNDFRTAFGEELEKLETEFLRMMQKIR